MNQRGFTLIELVIATSLLAAGMLVASISYTSISQLQQKGSAVREVQDSSRYVLDQIERDVRNSASITQVSSTEVKLANSPEATTTGEDYVFKNVGGHNDLLRCDYTGGSCQTITDQNIRVTATNFDYHNGQAPFLKIDMTLSYDPSLTTYQAFSYSYDVSTVVSPRDQ